MNNNKNTNEFTAGQIDADSITDVDAFLAPGAHLDTKRYLLGVFAGLNMKLGRTQQLMDEYNMNGDDDEAAELENELADMYEIIERFAEAII